MSFWFDPMVNTLGMPGNDGGVNARLDASFNQMPSNQAYVAAQNQAALAATTPKPYGYGHVPIATFGMSSPAAVAAQRGGGGGGGSVFSTGASPFNSYGLPGGGGAGSFSPSPNYPGGSGGSAEEQYQQYFNAPRQYGWDANEGAPAPAAPQVWNRGEFNPQTYGWDHNEGAPAPSFGMNLQPSGGAGAPSFGDIWKSRIAPQVPTSPSSVTVPGQQSGGGSAAEQYAAYMASLGGGGYDMGAQSRSVQNPMNRVDWGQSYLPQFSTGGAFQQALLASQYRPFDTGGGYNPWASNNTRLPSYDNMFGAPNSGYLGSQGRLNQDPFGGYVNPRDLDAGGSFPADYAPRYNAYGNAFNQ